MTDIRTDDRRAHRSTRSDRPRRRGLRSTRIATRRALESLEAFLRIPSISALPEHRRRLSRRGRVARRRAATAGVEHVEVVATDGHPVVYGDWLHADRRADGPRLRPLRRPAGRPARPVDLAAVRAGRRRRPDARPRRGRRQGPDPRSTSWPPAASWRRAAACRSTSATCSRARRSRARATSTRGSTANRDRLAADVASSATPASSRATCRRSPSACAGMMYAQIDVVGSPVDLHSGGYGGAVQNPANALARSSPRSRARTAGSASRASTTTSSPLTDAERAAFAALPFDEEALPRATRPAGARRRGRLHDARAARRPPDARRQRDLGRLPGRGLQDDHPGPRPRQGQLPARARPGPGPRSSSASATYVEPRSRRPASTVDRHVTSAAGARVADADRPSRRPRRPRGRSRRPSGARRSTSARAARSRSAPASSTSSACRSCCSASRQPDDNAHAPNEWMDLDNYETRHPDDRARLWDELAGCRAERPPTVPASDR